MGETIMETLIILAPALSLSFFAVVLFALDASPDWASGSNRQWGFWTALLGLMISGALIPRGSAVAAVGVESMVRWDGLS